MSVKCDSWAGGSRGLSGLNMQARRILSEYGQARLLEFAY